MRTIQDYREIYREIALNNGLRGDSVEVLVQLLANATYISEVENVVYAQESSLAQSTLVNSKIHHSMDMMYSVFRGSCPRVILNVVPTKFMSLSLGDILVTSNNFRVYYLGYWKESTQGDDKSLFGGFEYSDCNLEPSSTPTPLIGLIASETVSLSGSLTSENPYYLESLENDLSNDVFVYSISGNNRERKNVTRQFSEHVLDGDVFDLTLPGYGSRLYFADGSSFEALYYRYSTLDSYNSAELRKMVVRGADLRTFSAGYGDKEWIFSNMSEVAPGIAIFKEVSREDIAFIHYRANRERFLSQIVRSNSDIGSLLEEAYPEKIVPGGTTYKFTYYSGGSPNLTIYYVPRSSDLILTDREKSDYINSKKAYYVTDSVNIVPGVQYNAVISFEIDLISGSDSSTLSDEVSTILKNYQSKFGVDFSSGSIIREEIKSLISKISCVRSITRMNIDITNENGDVVEEISDSIPYYFIISYNISTLIQTKL